MNMSPISSVRSVGTRPQNYAVDNQSEISDAFADSLKTYGATGVTGPSPVQYTNAQTEDNKVSAVNDSAKANRFYNDIASAFQGVSTGYGANAQAQSYAMVGANFDAAV